MHDLLKEAAQKLAPDKRTQIFKVEGEVKGKQVVLRGEIHSAELRDQLLRFVADHSALTPVDSMQVLPSPALNGKTFGLASQSVINMRVKPDHGAELGSQALLGTPLKILKEKEGWHLVQTPDDYLGWVDDGLEVMDAAGYQRWADRKKIIITTEFGFTRSERNAHSQAVSDIVAGDLLALRGSAPGWFEVEYPDGRVAYVARDMAEEFDPWLRNAKDTPATIIATAKRFMGIPYFWGGTSCKALDCSGFTKTVYYLNGVLLPRDASQQARVGAPVDSGVNFGGMKVGDLLFFGTRASADKKERVTHVGISLGAGRFIHEGGDVRINSLSESDPEYSAPRAKSFLFAKRIIGVGEEHGVRRLSQLPYYRSHEH